ncbi:hypothetical protein [Endozoicomonas sp. Mp262]|uniref:hypothetical protein n=1 Tax=Endozoicomonas sp. Mp262 TaxID=2919499 RepID=UPI0021DA9E57
MPQKEKEGGDVKSIEEGVGQLLIGSQEKTDDKAGYVRYEVGLDDDYASTENGSMDLKRISKKTVYSVQQRLADLPDSFKMSFADVAYNERVAAEFIDLLSREDFGDRILKLIRLEPRQLILVYAYTFEKSKRYRGRRFSQKVLSITNYNENPDAVIEQRIHRFFDESSRIELMLKIAIAFGVSFAEISLIEALGNLGGTIGVYEGKVGACKHINDQIYVMGEPEAQFRDYIAETFHGTRFLTKSGVQFCVAFLYPFIDYLGDWCYQKLERKCAGMPGLLSCKSAYKKQLERRDEEIKRLNLIRYICAVGRAEELSQIQGAEGGVGLYGENGRDSKKRYNLNDDQLDKLYALAKKNEVVDGVVVSGEEFFIDASNNFTVNFISTGLLDMTTGDIEEILDFAENNPDIEKLECALELDDEDFIFNESQFKVSNYTIVERIDQRLRDRNTRKWARIVTRYGQTYLLASLLFVGLEMPMQAVFNLSVMKWGMALIKYSPERNGLNCSFFDGTIPFTNESYHRMKAVTGEEKFIVRGEVEEISQNEYLKTAETIFNGLSITSYGLWCDYFQKKYQKERVVKKLRSVVPRVFMRELK